MSQRLRNQMWDVQRQTLYAQRFQMFFYFNDIKFLSMHKSLENQSLLFFLTLRLLIFVLSDFSISLVSMMLLLMLLISWLIKSRPLSRNDCFNLNISSGMGTINPWLSFWGWLILIIVCRYLRWTLTGSRLSPASTSLLLASDSIIDMIIFALDWTLASASPAMLLCMSWGIPICFNSILSIITPMLLTPSWNWQIRWLHKSNDQILAIQYCFKWSIW